MNQQNDSHLGRRRIEFQLASAGWTLQAASDSGAARTERSFAQHEFSSGEGRTYYTLYENKRVLGIIEALDGESPSQGLDQARNQSRLIEQKPRYQGQYGVPFLYSADGVDIHFCDVRRPQNHSRKLSAFHTPDALLELADRDLDSELAVLQGIPTNYTLRYFQADAIRQTEAAIAAGHRKMILSMATGTGKTMMVVNEIYRLMKAGVARRTLILQNRTALVLQTAQIFSSFEVEPGMPFETAFPVYTPFVEEQAFPGVLPAGLSHTEGPFVHIARAPDIAELLGQGREETVDDQEQLVNKRSEIPIHTFDLIVAEDCDSSRSGSYGTAWRRVIDYFDAIKIGISNVPVFDGADEFDDFVVYSYDLNAAVRDGSLVNYEAVRTRPTIQHWRMPTTADAYKRHDVFLSYAREDASDVAVIARNLRDYGINVRPADPEILSEEYPFPSILNELRTRDTFVILLSPASIRSLWIESELDTVLERRGVEVIPALLKPCPVPRFLADRTVVDLSSGVQSLVNCLEANARIDLKALSTQAFERLAADLLRRLYFDLDEPEEAHDRGYDFRGVFRDALGFADPTEYLIQVKSHKGARSSVNALQAFAEVIASEERRPRGLWVTSSQLTSVAAKALRRINEQNAILIVIDGLKFKNLLLRYPDLISKYFPADKVADRNE